MNLQESTEQYFKEAVARVSNYLRDQEEVSKLPKAIQMLDGHLETFKCYDGTINITMTFFEPSAVGVLQFYGAEFEKPKLSSWSGDFTVRGKLGNAKVIVYNLAVPAKCTVFTKQEAIPKYYAVCNETEEEL